MLKSKTIRAAKECIQIVKQELGVKLTLSQPEFMAVLRRYVDVSDSNDLKKAYNKLVASAGIGGALYELKSLGSDNERDLPHELKLQHQVNKVIGADFKSEELVEYQGRRYPKWREGKQFKGVYRGSPHYV